MHDRPCHTGSSQLAGLTCVDPIVEAGSGVPRLGFRALRSGAWTFDGRHRRERVITQGDRTIPSEPVIGAGALLSMSGSKGQRVAMIVRRGGEERRVEVSVGVLVP